MDGFAVIPLGAHVKLFGARQSLSLMVKPTSPELLQTAMDDATVALRVSRRLKPSEPDNFGILTSDTLLGLYQGTPLTERRWDYGNALPDRILLFQGPHEREADDDDDLVVSIAETLIHEIGHYFGLSEEEIEEIEEKYWRRHAT